MGNSPSTSNANNNAQKGASQNPPPVAVNIPASSGDKKDEIQQTQTPAAPAQAATSTTASATAATAVPAATAVDSKADPTKGSTKAIAQTGSAASDAPKPQPSSNELKSTPSATGAPAATAGSSSQLAGAGASATTTQPPAKTSSSGPAATTEAGSAKVLKSEPSASKDEPASKKPNLSNEGVSSTSSGSINKSKIGMEPLPNLNNQSLHKLPSLVKTASKKSTGQIPAEDVDIGDLSIEQVLKMFSTSENGLTEEQVLKAREKYGPNALPEVAENKCLKFLMFMWNPLSWVMEMAAIVAIVLSNGPTPWLCTPIDPPNCASINQAPDYEDFIGIVILLILNSVIGYIEESAAGDAVAKLMAQLSPRCNVKRGGEWKEIDAKDLVPGDIVTIKLGDIIPADLKLLEGEPLKVDQSGLTGESLPVTKNPGDEVYSGTTVKKGEIHAVVFATGVNTFFGKAANLVATTEQHGHLQQVLTQIGGFCMSYIGLWIVIIVIVVYANWHWDYRRGINMVLVVLIGGIPIAMPTVLSVTMALGVNDLAKQNAIVTRITAVEELAGMDILCSDKTGTLTKNKLEVDTPTTCGEGVTVRDVLLLAGLSARREGDPDAIDICVANACKKELGETVFNAYKVTKFIPFNPTDKRTEAFVEQSDGTKFRASKGAPQVMIDIAYNSSEIREEQERIINDFASRGLRTIGVGKSTDDGKTWQFIGLIPLLDPPRDDTKETIEKAIGLGVRVKMITGDQVAIGKETARRLGMGLNFHNAKVVRSEFVDGIPIAQIIEEADGFGEVFPEDKYAVVAGLRKLQNGPYGGNHIVGMTGDGVNDAPALKVADVGIAVADATDAARSAADMVLLTEGLSVIITAIEGSRRIFQRMKNYAIYACATTIRIVTTFGILACAWEFSFPPFMVLVIAYLNDGTILTISKDYAVASPTPDAWRLREIFIQAFVIGIYLTASTLVFYYLINFTTFFENTFKVPPIKYNTTAPVPVYNADGTIQSAQSFQMASVIYLQVSITGQIVIFSTRARNYFFTSLPSPYLMGAFVVAQLIATLIAVYAYWDFTQIYGIGWQWAGIAWIWSFIWYIPLDCLKILARLILTGDLWNATLFDQKAMFKMNINAGASHMSGAASRRAPNSRAYALASNAKASKKA